MIRRSDLEEREIQTLAPYAVKARFGKGRKYPEKEHEFRTAFQRDRDRILHSTAFRRLQYKTQVFVNHEGDHYRTRLTHTLEVSQIGRTICRVLGLNEDLIEAISLAHDLGHGPFGHAGERALTQIMKGHGGFEHNLQSLRIVEVLEESYPEFPGLNLSFEVLDGMKKHGEPLSLRSGAAKSPAAKGGGSRKRKIPVYLEAQLADIADEIAYDSHDVEDALRSGLIEESALEELALWREITSYIRKKYASIDESQKRRLATRLLINRQAQDLISNTQKNIDRCGIRSLSDLGKTSERMVGFSREMTQLKKEWRSFLSERFYNHYRIVRMTEKGVRLIRAIFQVYLERPAQLPPTTVKRAKKEGLYRAICDYIAGMTDRFAQDEYQRLFEPYERV